ncbi:MAG TPA: VOC family protein [Stellaceae bacterium]|nr:VOC family protein [Stellaceae bacterium]
MSGVIPYLMIDGALKAAEFYKAAFGAEVVMAQPPDDKGRTMHVHLQINGGSLMMSDCYPEHGHPPEPHKGFNLLLPVTDIDAAYKRAIDAGATEVMAPQDMFWGDRYGQLRDPFGVLWAFNQPIKR